MSAGGAVLENGGSGHLLLYVVLGCTDTTFASPLGLFGLSFFLGGGGSVLSLLTYGHCNTDKTPNRRKKNAALPLKLLLHETAIIYPC